MISVEKDYGECPVHRVKYTSVLICPMCLIDEFEAEERRQEEDDKEDEMYRKTVQGGTVE